MREFIGDDFLLNSETAVKLYETFAKEMPIIDYHCHIDAKEIACDIRFENITQVWLGADHYKWRLMRTAGVEEKYITGDAPDREKFQKWAETLEMAIGNPLYHWTHLELKRYFNCDMVLNGDNAEAIWQHCNKMLKKPEMSARSLVINSGVKLICTTDDPADDLRWHKAIREDESFNVQVLPAWRPDNVMNIEKEEYADYINRLSEAAGVSVADYDSLKEALRVRMQYFADMGCVASDHGFEYIMYEPASDEEVAEIFNKALMGEKISHNEVLKFKTAFMLFVAKEYRKLGWVMQLHYSCKRNNNTKMFEKVGPDTGFDVINGNSQSWELADLLNAFEMNDSLPKTIVYSLNPNDNEAIDSIIGSFQNSEAVGKIQHGSAWWFNDNRDGMIRHMKSLANQGILGNFIGMLTDSRSFLSYSRHEYFRRILCDIVGEWVEAGEYPYDMASLEKIIKGISYNNVVRYFGFTGV